MLSKYKTKCDLMMELQRARLCPASVWLAAWRGKKSLQRFAPLNYFFLASSKWYTNVTVPSVGPQPVRFMYCKLCCRVFSWNLLTCCYANASNIYMNWNNVLTSRLPEYVTLTIGGKAHVAFFLYLFVCEALHVRNVLGDYFSDQRLLTWAPTLFRHRCSFSGNLYKKKVCLCKMRHVYHAYS